MAYEARCLCVYGCGFGKIHGCRHNSCQCVKILQGGTIVAEKCHKCKKSTSPEDLVSFWEFRVCYDCNKELDLCLRLAVNDFFKVKQYRLQFEKEDV